MALGRIFLVPTPIGERDVYDVLPEYNRTIIRKIDYFVVENLRSARRFLGKAGIGKPIDSLTFKELNEHTRPEELEGILEPVLRGTDCGILSEAGVPAVADPGAGLVALAHRYGAEVIPLVRPSSLLLALMASGLNGQSFAFNGYLPIKQPDRSKAIRCFEARARKEQQPQLFIEAPYRNQKLLEEFLTVCGGETLLTVAVNILEPDQMIRTLSISGWKENIPQINKKPTVFILG